MRAVKIKQFGGVEGLEVVEIDEPIAVADRVRVRVHTAALNRADLLQRRGRYPAPLGYPTDIPGLEFAGEVDQVGDEVSRWKIGERVFGITGGGAQAEYIVVPESTLAEIPDNLDWIEAGAIPEAFITAHDALFTQGTLQMGERVLIHAVGSGVGLAAMQLARATGAIVFGTTRTEEKLNRAKELGLHDGIVVKDPNEIVEAVDQLTSGHGVNVILDLVGGAYLSANLRALAKNGRMILVGTVAGASGELDYGLVMRKRLMLIGTVLRSRSIEQKAYATLQFASHVIPLLKSGVVKPIIDAVYPIEEIVEAHKHLESNRNFGKIVIKVKA
jgi:NADPH:quinone reductase